MNTVNRTIDRSNLSDQVYAHIKRMILSGELKGGDRVPEAKLSQIFGVSRTPLREALKKLSDYGLIFLKPRSYAEVVIINEDEARQIAELRLNLEIFAAKGFSRNAASEKYDTLRELSERCLEMNNMGDKAASFELDSSFHLFIAENCGNQFLFEMYEKLDARIQLLRLNQQLNTDILKDYIYQHNVLISAMEKNEEKLIQSILTSHIVHDF